jgi:Xaa-Pro aminopeptidase
VRDASRRIRAGHVGPPSAEEQGLSEQLDRRRRAVAEAWGLGKELVLVGAGDPIPIPGRGDPTYPFRAHCEYLYLTDRNHPGGVLAFDPETGWFDFLAPVTPAERLWSGSSELDPATLTTDALPGWLAERAGRPVAVLGAPLPQVETSAAAVVLGEELRFALSARRRRKDEIELERMRAAARMTAAAFAATLPLLHEGISERELQIELEAAAFRAGADAMGYDTIVAAGPNSAVLHFAPSGRQLRDGELVLVDAGAEHRGYVCDVTRTYPVGGSFSAGHEVLHSVVRRAELAAIERCAAGVEWRDVHLTAALAISEGLVEFGVLRGRPESLVESGAAALFFPHGIGHLIGLGVRDAGGILAERRDDPPPIPNLRVNLPLEPGMVVTVEPGIYFLPALLEDSAARSRHADEVIWGRLDSLCVGGIRIEDDVLITQDGPEVLTVDIPQ